MSKSKLMSKKKEIKMLREELLGNGEQPGSDAVYKRIKENLRGSVQLWLLKEGHIGPELGMYDKFIDRAKMDIEETELMLDTEMKVIHPTYAYQTNNRWIELQKTKHENHLKVLRNGLKEIESNVEEGINAINAQAGRIKERRPQILHRLEELGVDITELKEDSPDYIG